MKKIGRNEQCRCGSGEKFKRCCGRITSQLSSVDEPISKFAHLALQDAMNIRQASQDRHRLNHGEVKEIISSRFRDFQIVASGSKIVYSRNWKVFPDFLNQQMLATTLEAQFRSELELEWMNVQDENWPKGFPAIGVVFYNDACSWYLNETIQTNKAPIWTYILRSKRCRENFEIEPLLKQIGTGCLQRCNIPLNFPDL